VADFILALDQGTSSSRAILLDHAGTAVASAQQPFEQVYPRPGWVEHDPEAIWQSQIETARQVLARAKVAPGDIAAIGITNQRETAVIWDGSGRPIANAVVWQDRRTAPICDDLRARGSAATSCSAPWTPGSSTGSPASTPPTTPTPPAP